MPTKLYKKLLILGIVASLAAMLLFWLIYRAPDKLEVDFLDVGQGDAILIKTPGGQNVLIDGGPDKTVVKRLGENLPFWDKRIDLMILTHPHDDHVAGLVEVLKRYEVTRILYTGATHNAPNYLTWLKTARDKKVFLTIVDKPKTLALGRGVELKIFYPEQSFLNKEVKDLNDSSIVMKLVYGQSAFLLTGDAGLAVEKNLLAGGADLMAEVLKVGHHGSEYSTSQEFLDKVKPRMAVIEVGKDNDFGHPNLRIVKRLERAGARVLRTDLDGTIKMESGGVEVRIK